MNDEQEFRYTVDLAAEVLRSRDASHSRVATHIAMTWPDMLEYMSKRPYFVASFCEQGDVLSQWRAYSAGGRGLSLGFDSADLMQATITGTAFTVPCVYDRAVQQNRIHGVLDDLEAALDPLNGEPGVDVDRAAAKFYQ